MNFNFNKRINKQHQEFVAKISSYEQKLEHVFYTLLIIGNFNVKVSHVRYSDLKNLHARIVHLVKNCKLDIVLPEFPKRKLFGKTNSSTEHIQNRMMDITSYMNSLLTNEKVYDFPGLKCYLPEEDINDNSLLNLIPALAPSFDADEYDRDRCWNEMNELKQNFADKQDQRTAGKQGIRQCYLFDIEEYDSSHESVYYLIVIRDLYSHERWSHKARYSDLLNFHQAMLKEHIKADLPEFPKRKIFTITNDSETLIESRKQQLVKYLNSLYSIHDVILSDVGQYFINSTKRMSKKNQIETGANIIQKLKISYQEAPIKQRTTNLKLPLIQETEEMDLTQSQILNN